MTLLDQVGQARLYGILDLGYVAPQNVEEMTSLMLEGGVQVLQLRAKKVPEDTIATLGRSITPLCRAAGVPFIINDYPHLVSPTGADGTHVGQDDMSVAEARRLAGPGALVGKSTHSVEQALATASEKPDYIGFGPLFATPTKPDYRPIGLSDIEEVHRMLDLPIFCIGGIKLENISTVLASGARRCVIVSGILQAADVSGYCRQCLDYLSRAR